MHPSAAETDARRFKFRSSLTAEATPYVETEFTNGKCTFPPREESASRDRYQSTDYRETLAASFVLRCTSPEEEVSRRLSFCAFLSTMPLNFFILAVFLFAGGVFSQQLKQQQEDPCQVKSRVVGDATYCDRYWECIGGQPELYDCPNGLVFAGKHRGVTEGCDYPWRANYCEGKQLANGPIGTEHCDWLYGIFGHETSCTRYWTCWNGTATEQLCIGGLLYNENTHSCDWPENVDGCQKHPLCNDDANGNVPLGKSCNRYWQCQGGYPRLQRCPAMLVFDRRSLRCVVPPTEDCDVPTTQPPPPEEEEEENLPPQDLRGRPQSFAGNHRNQAREEINLPNLPQGAIPLPVRSRN